MSIQPQENLTLWNHWNQSHGPNYPQEKVIQFVFRNFSAQSRSQSCALDLGCGSGVNTEFLVKEGFITSGVDLSPIGIQNTKQRLSKSNLSATLKVSSIEEIPFTDQSFDLVISVGVFECAGLALAQKSILEIHRVLKLGGKGIFLFASDRDFRIHQNDNLFQLYGYSEDEVTQIFSSVPFAELNYDRYITTFQNQSHQSNDFLITIQK